MYATDGIVSASKCDLCPAITSAATLPSCTALCANIGCPTISPIAKMFETLVRSCLSTAIKPYSSTATPANSAPIFLPFGLRPTATKTASKISDSGAPLPSNDTFKPSSCASIAVTLVSSQMFLYCFLILRNSGVTKSLSHSGIICSRNSTT